MVVVARSYYTLYMRAARVVCWCTQRAGLAPARGLAPTPDTPVVARMPEQPKQRKARRRKTVPSANDKLMAEKKRAEERKQRLEDAQAQLEAATTSSQVATGITECQRVLEEEDDEGGGVGSNEEGQHSKGQWHTLLRDLVATKRSTTPRQAVAALKDKFGVDLTPDDRAWVLGILHDLREDAPAKRRKTRQTVPERPLY